MNEPRTVTVTGWLARHHLREYMYSHRIHWRQPPDEPEVFIITATDEQWDGIQQAKQEAER